MYGFVSLCGKLIGAVLSSRGKMGSFDYLLVGIIWLLLFSANAVFFTKMPAVVVNSHRGCVIVRITCLFHIKQMETVMKYPVYSSQEH